MRTKDEIAAIWAVDRDIERIVAADKEISANIRWISSGRHRFRLEARVLVTTTSELLTLEGKKGTRNRSLVLLFQNKPICKFTVHHKTRNVDGQEIREAHKHVWDVNFQDHLVYIPGDINAGNINEEFDGFLKECNIRLVGSYEPLS